MSKKKRQSCRRCNVDKVNYRAMVQRRGYQGKDPLNALIPYWA